MVGFKLKTYMDLRGYSVTKMAKVLGRSRQNIETWIARDAVVEILEDDNLKVMTMNVVHEPQVRS